MKKAIFIGVVLTWVAAFSILVIALTDIYPNNPIKPYRFIVGIGFLVLSRLLAYIYKNTILRVEPDKLK